jgi:hypothetical protein
MKWKFASPHDDKAWELGKLVTMTEKVDSKAKADENE